jgi:hypothetical protein
MTAYRDDLAAAQARNADLERKNRNLSEENRRLGSEVSTLRLKIPKTKPKKVKKMKCRECGGRFHRMGLLMFGIVSAILIFGSLFWLIYTAATENGPGGCYIQSESMTFKLMQTIEWGNDRQIGQYRLMDEALQDAEKLHCPVADVVERPDP